MSEFKYTEQTIQKCLNGFFAIGSIKYNVDNLYVFSWESDKLLWTKSGYIYEFEIKISRADYKNDFKKSEKHIILSYGISEKLQRVYEQDLFAKEHERHQWCSEDWVRDHYNAERVAKGKRKPNYFYYAVPKGLIDVDEVPKYAGLIWVDDGILCIKKKAPCLHKEKYTDAQLNLGEKFYYNWKNAKMTLRQTEKDVEYYKTQLEHEIESKGHECSWDELKSEVKKWKREAKIKANLYLTMVEGADYNSIEHRMLIAKIREYNPQFDYSAFMKDVDKKYEERYPNRK